jgi:hypothetical protein
MLRPSNKDRDVAAAYRLQASRYLVKPMDSEKFLEVSSNLGWYRITLNQAPI